MKSVLRKLLGSLSLITLCFTATSFSVQADDDSRLMIWMDRTELEKNSASELPFQGLFRQIRSNDRLQTLDAVVFTGSFSPEEEAYIRGTYQARLRNFLNPQRPLIPIYFVDPKATLEDQRNSTIHLINTVLMRMSADVPEALLWGTNYPGDENIKYRHETYGDLSTLVKFLSQIEDSSGYVATLGLTESIDITDGDWRRVPDIHNPLSADDYREILRRWADPTAEAIEASKGEPSVDYDTSIFTDAEPDDHVAIAMWTVLLSDPQNQIGYIGANVMNSGLKTVETIRLLESSGLDIPVYQGTGGIASDYPDIASSSAARSFDDFGKTTLSPAEYEQGLNMGRSSQEATQRYMHYLRGLLDAGRSSVLALQTEGGDVAWVVTALPHLKRAVHKIVMQGGWNEMGTDESGVVDRRATYNWNMNPLAANRLLRSGVNIELHSSHIIKETFDGAGSISSSNYPAVIEAWMEATDPNSEFFSPTLVDVLQAGLAWGEHLIAGFGPKIEAIEAGGGDASKLKSIIKAIRGSEGKQFTPADPLLTASITNPELVPEGAKVGVNLKLVIETDAEGNVIVDKKTANSGVFVEYEEAPGSKVKLVTAYNTELFGELLLRTMREHRQRSQVRLGGAESFEEKVLGKYDPNDTRATAEGDCQGPLKTN